MNALSEIIETQSAPPPELPRLTVAQTFITYQRIGIQLEAACEQFKKLPNVSSEGDGKECLNAIVRSCEGIIRHSQRLLEANR